MITKTKPQSKKKPVLKTVTKPERLPNPHPGRILQRHFLEPLNLNQAQLSAATGLPQSRISELIKGRRGITVDSAIRLARVIGPHEQFWLGLQAQYDMEEALLSRGAEYDALKRVQVPASAAA
ncbi:MAG: HigA family addiction module antitoxin [Prosthecobacter sp.]